MRTLLAIVFLLLASRADAQITLGPIAVGDTFTDTNVSAGGTCVASGTGTTPNTTCTYGGLWQVHKSILNAIVSQLCTCFPGNTGPTGATGATGSAGSNGAAGATGATGPGVGVADTAGSAVAGTFMIERTPHYWIGARSSYWRVDQYTGNVAPLDSGVYYADASCTVPIAPNTLVYNVAYRDQNNTVTPTWFVPRPITATASSCYVKDSGCSLNSCGGTAWVSADVYTSLPTALHSGPVGAHN